MPFFKKEKSWKTIRNEILASRPVPVYPYYFLLDILTKEIEQSDEDKQHQEEAVMSVYLLLDTFYNEKILALLPTESVRQQYIEMLQQPRLPQSEYDNFVHKYIPNFTALQQQWGEEFRDGAYEDYEFTKDGEWVKVE